MWLLLIAAAFAGGRAPTLYSYGYTGGVPYTWTVGWTYDHWYSWSYYSSNYGTYDYYSTYTSGPADADVDADADADTDADVDADTDADTDVDTADTGAGKDACACDQGPAGGWIGLGALIVLRRRAARGGGR